MNISTITVSRTVQARQYEPLVFTVSAALGEGEDAMAVSGKLLALVKRVLFDATGKMRPDLRPPLDTELAPLFDDQPAADGATRAVDRGGRYAH